MGKTEFRARREVASTAIGRTVFAALCGATAGFVAFAPALALDVGVGWLAAGAALAGFAFAAAARRVLRRRRRAVAETGFDALLGGSDDPSALTDRAGTALAANRALLTTPLGPEDRLIGELLAPWSTQPDSLAYRLLNAAAERGGAVEAVAGSGGAVLVRARRAGQEAMLWTVEALPERVKPDYASALFASFRLARDGDVLAVNEAYRRLDPLARETIVQAARAARREGRAHGVVELPGGARGALVLGVADEQGETDVALLTARPAPGSEPPPIEGVWEDVPVALVRIDPGGEILSVNAAARGLLGAEARPGRRLSDLVEGLGRPMAARIAEAARGDASGRPDLVRGLVDGRERFLHVSLTRLTKDPTGTMMAVVADATQVKTLEDQFVQSQKMQAVGQLAGGVAHDFNNLLTAIAGHCDLLLLRRESDDPDFADLSQIKQNANRASSLVRQLLAFSRKQTMTPKTVGLIDALDDLSHLLNRLLGERVSLDVRHGEGLGAARIDERQFEQVIMNLVVNARDAMLSGGTVSIVTRNESYRAETRRDRAAIPGGEYVAIAVSDEGEGVPPDKLGKIFEPFFTTKRPGEGTGLGLSTAYGIVKQMGGFIFAESAPGEGATFTVLLPRVMDAETTAQEAKPRADLTGAGQILLVEDEAPVRAFARRALSLRGYTVTEAASAEAALELLADPEFPVDLLVSDVVMPGADGPSWVREARKSRPDVGVVFISGYAEDVFRHGLDGLGDYRFLAKPFTLDELAATVKAATPSGLESPAA